MPVGVPAPGATGATVAVNVVDCPNAEGFWLLVTAVVVFAFATVWVRPAEVLVL